MPKNSVKNTLLAKRTHNKMFKNVFPPRSLFSDTKDLGNNKFRRLKKIEKDSAEGAQNIEEIKFIDPN